MSEIFSAAGVVSLITLTLLEIVLGIDNIIFISIVSNKLPEAERPKARRIGLFLALGFRILMLFGITVIMSFKEPIISFEVVDFAVRFSGRDIILLLGGLFLIAKSTSEMHHKIKNIEEHEEAVKNTKKVALSKIIVQIVLLDIVFSFDSILTAVGIAQHLPIMIMAVILSMIIMMSFAGKISDFINRRPTLQILALSFLVLIGFMLLLESFHFEVPKGYIYFAVCYALVVEIINMRFEKKRKKSKAHENV